MAERSSTPYVALFDAVEDQRRLLTATLRVLGCRVHVLVPSPKGLPDIVEQLERHGPFDVVIWELSPVLRGPCEALKSLWAGGAFAQSGLVITTTEEPLVGPMLGPLSARAHILARPYTFSALMQAVGAAEAAGGRRGLAVSHADPLVAAATVKADLRRPRSLPVL